MVPFDGFNAFFGEGQTAITTGQMCARAVVVFIFGLLATRVGAWRAFGRWAAPDIVITVIVGSNLSRTLTGPAPLIPTMAATAVLIGAYWLVSYAAARSDLADRLLKGVPVVLVSQGKLDQPAMRQAAISKRDLDEALREKGVVASERVCSALLERNGSITVIRDEDIK